jgi:hypothetical protein
MTDQWWKVDLGSIQKMTELQEQFFAVFAANGSPRGAAMFANDTLGPQVEIYFTPKAVEIARPLLLSHGGKPTEKPADGSFLVGHDQDKTMLPRGKRHRDVTS